MTGLDPEAVHRTDSPIASMYGKYRPPRFHRASPPTAYPGVKNAGDEAAAYEAYTTLPNLIDYRAKIQPDLPCIGEADRAAQTTEILTLARVRQLLLQFARAFFLAGLEPRRPGEPPIVVALAGISGIDFFLADHALQRTGAVPLLLSWTLSSSAAAGLIERCGASYLLFGPGSETLAADLPPHIAKLSRLPWMSRHDCNGSLTEAETDAVDELTRSKLSGEEQRESIGFILHSTGSTADPKPIPQLNKAYMAMSLGLLSGDAATFLVTHHAGFTFSCVGTIAKGKLYIIIPAASYDFDSVSRGLTAVLPHVASIQGPPIFVTVLMKRPEGVAILRRIEKVALAGAALNAVEHKILSDVGVEVWSSVASTETGNMLETDPQPVLGAGDWMATPKKPYVDDLVEFQQLEDGSDLHELFIKEGHPTLQVCNKADGYATGDLFKRHPTELGRWKYVMRIDDVLAHSTGIKTDALAIEAALGASPHIRYVVAVGSGYEHAGALVVPSSSEVTETDFQPVINELNAKLPVQSRLLPGFVQMLNHTDTFAMTPKGTVIRAKTIKKYAKTIEQMYTTPRATDPLASRNS